LGPNFFHDLVQHKHSPNRYKAAGGKYKVQNQTPIAKPMEQNSIASQLQK